MAPLLLFLLFFLLPDNGHMPSGKTETTGVTKQRTPVPAALTAIPVSGTMNGNMETVTPEPIISYKQTTPVNTQLMAVGGYISNTNSSSMGNTSVKTTTNPSTILSTQ